MEQKEVTVTRMNEMNNVKGLLPERRQRKQMNFNLP